jgi:L-seryl-tRNA(Ser) seleniumtransferase
MAARSVPSLRARAQALGVGQVVDLAGVFGGGSQPGLAIPSAGVALAGDHTAALRRWGPPIVARVTDGATVVDLRTVDPADDETVAKALASCQPATPTP